MSEATNPYIYIDDRDDLKDCAAYDENGPYFDPYASQYTEPDDLWGEDDDQDYWLNECSYIEGQGCLKAGSEECDFECPFNRSFYIHSQSSDAPLLIDRILSLTPDGISKAIDILFYFHHLMQQQCQAENIDNQPEPPWPHWTWAVIQGLSSNENSPWEKSKPAPGYDEIPF